jgi:hypothetical protein
VREVFALKRQLKRTPSVQIAAIAIGLLGFSAGLVFRLNFLIVILVLLLVLSAGYNVAHHFSLLPSILIMIGVQVIAQGSYFLGLVARSLASLTR